MKTVRTVLMAGVCLSTTMGFAQTFPLAPPPGPQVYPNPMKEDNTGFEPIFDGKTLNGWDGDPRYWRVENGEIVGEGDSGDAVEAEQLSDLAWRRTEGLRTQG